MDKSSEPPPNYDEVALQSMPSNQYVKTYSVPTQNWPNQNPVTPGPSGQAFQPVGFQETSQPSQWLMSEPNIGLRILDNVDEINIERVVDLKSGLLGIRPMSLKRQFCILNKNSQQIFFIGEDESCLSQSAQRSFLFTAKDSHGQHIFQVSRDTQHCPCGFCCACLPGCRSEAIIKNSQGLQIGHLQQSVSCCSANFYLYDQHNAEVMHITGVHAACTPGKHYDMKMLIDGSRGFMDKIGDTWGSGLNKYTMRFPPGANREIKACCIGAVILFDFRFHLIPNQGRN